MRSHYFTLALGVVTLGAIGARASNGGSSAEVRHEPPAVLGTAVPSQAAQSTAADTPAAEGATEEEPSSSPVETALQALRKHVRKQSHPDALRMALQAYYNYKASNPGQLRNPYYYYVDDGLDNRTPRGYVFDMKALKVVEGPFTVAHGRASSSSRNGVPTRFSNAPGSNATSLGLYLTQETYNFSGSAAGGRYSSIGLRLKGLSGRFNSTARQRGVVAHGAPYVTAGDAGRSEGCPAMEQSRARRLLPMIANGGLTFLFSPHDKDWMKNDPWASKGAGRVATAD
jgi:hypothetical protein